MTAAIRVSGIGKKYRVPHSAGGGAGYRTLREGLADLAKAPARMIQKRRNAGRDEEFWALRDVSFEVHPGEVVGIIGRNGAGKSTLLKILSRITKPTTGRIDLEGRVGSLLEVGTGFHPELTGRENIFLNGSILGMSRREVRGKFDEIVDFAGVERFLDTPVKRYSSGMYVRLAFAVAAHLEPEILVVDEVLAVGDQAFQNKCIGKMNSITAGGRTVLIVSHNLPMLSSLCTQAAWLEQGSIRQVGPIQDVIDAYSSMTSAETRSGSTADLEGHPGHVHRRAEVLRRVSIADEKGQPASQIPLGGDFSILVEMAGYPWYADLRVAVEICDLFGSKVAEVNSHVQSMIDLAGAGAGATRLSCRVVGCPLVPGDYVLNIGLGDTEDYLEKVDGALKFAIEPRDIYGTGKVPNRKNGCVALSASWDFA